MPKQHDKVRLLMVLAYVAFAFAFRITMLVPGQFDSHLPDLTGDLMMSYDVTAEIIGARSIIDGSFDMYKGRYSKNLVGPAGLAISYPPLTAYLQVPIVFAGKLLGLQPLGMAMIAISAFPYIILSVLCACRAGFVLKETLNVTDEMTVTTTVLLLLFSSLMFWVVTYPARFEFVAALFLLLAMSALANERYGWAGFSLGLALMTKQTVLPAVIVFVAVILAGTLNKEITLRRAVRFLTALPVPFLMLIPFFVASPHDLGVGLFGTSEKVNIIQVSFINGVLQVGKLLFEEEVLREFLRVYSNSIILALCIAFVLLVIKKKNVRPGTGEFCALVALASFFFPVLGKYTNLTRYAVVASVFVVLWGASRKPGFPHEAVWFIVLQSFILDHVPVVWKQHVGLIFYGIVFFYVYFAAFTAKDTDSVTVSLRRSYRKLTHT